MAAPPSEAADLGGYVANIISAYVSNHAVEASDLPMLIRSVQAALAALEEGASELPLEERPEPAAPIRRSVFPEYIVCLEDGKRFKSLKRHLRTTYNLSPEQYRSRWGLPSSYPMTAPNYAKYRSESAKKFGLGHKPKSEQATVEQPEAVVRQVPRARRDARPSLIRDDSEGGG